MDSILIRDIGTKALLIGAGTLLVFWTVSAIRLVIGARGINPLVSKFFNQIAAGRVDAAYLLTTKGYKQHVTRQDFIKFLAGLQLNRYRNLKSGRPRLNNDQIILTLNLKSEDKKNELPLDFNFLKVDGAWKIDRISKVSK
tara:strand:- start:1110 stop:1532 length:423 start_codon:yes stop_codon:yes gene_type:complete